MLLPAVLEPLGRVRELLGRLLPVPSALLLAGLLPLLLPGPLLPAAPLPLLLAGPLPLLPVVPLPLLPTVALPPPPVGALCMVSDMPFVFPPALI